MRLPLRVVEFLPLVLVLACQPLFSRAAPDRIDSVRKGPLGMQVGIQGDTNYYHVLESALTLYDPFTLTAMMLSSNGLVEFLIPASVTQQFLRIRSVPLAGSMDSDDDGMPDVFELRHPPLDPLDGSDAAISSDEDSLTNREEYQQNTNPFAGDTDGDGFGDDDEITWGGDPTDPQVRPISPYALSGFVAMQDAVLLNRASSITGAVPREAGALPLSALNRAPPANEGAARHGETAPVSVHNGL